MDIALVRAWTAGWAVSRGAAEPEEEPEYLTVQVGLSHQVTRHILPRADETLVRKLTESITAPGVWLKTFEPPETIAPWMSPGWAFDADGFLMSTSLRPRTPKVPDGYRLSTWTRGGVTRVLVRTEEGAFAARGQVALPDGSRQAVVDQVETEPGHRRRGLGSLVMRTLAHAGTAAGAHTGLLGATVEGRGLYEALGWRVEGPLTGIVRGPLPPAAGITLPGTGSPAP